MSRHEPATAKQISKLMHLLNLAGIRGFERAMAWIAERGFRVASFEELTKHEASILIGSLTRLHESGRHSFTNGK